VLELLVSVQTVGSKILALALVTCKILELQMLARMQLQSVFSPSLKLAVRARELVSVHTLCVTLQNCTIHKGERRAVLTIHRHLTDING
jgi:hypothetical protein